MSVFATALPQLICTDLDGTLLPDGATVEPEGARERFAQLAKRSEITLAYVTGRHRDSVDEAIVEFGVPTPDYAICDVGSSIYKSDGGQAWNRVRSWEERMGLGWPHGARANIVAALSNDSQLRAQESIRQSLHKISYYTDELTDVGDLPSRVRARLSEAGLKAKVVYSVDHARSLGLLDLLPPGSGKLAAIEHLMETGGFERDATLFAGDSGNDLEVLGSSIPAVLVANAKPEIRARAMAQAKEGGHSGRLHLAVSGENYAAGIVAGLLHYWPEAEAWLR